MIFSRSAPILLLIAALTYSGCQSQVSDTPSAVLVNTDADTIETVKALLGNALGSAQIEFGAVDLATSSVIPVLPPRLSGLEGNSPATPTLFDLKLKNDACFAVRRNTGEAVALPGIACQPALAG